MQVLSEPIDKALADCANDGAVSQQFKDAIGCEKKK